MAHPYKSWMLTPQSQSDNSIQPFFYSKRFELGIAVMASILSIGSYLYYLSTNAILMYGDSISHLMIAKRILSSPTPGLGQSGGLWPPLIHWLSLPLINNDWMYRTGTAGSILSMAAFVITALVIYKITRMLIPADVHWPAVSAAVIFMTNRDMLYMQATPMTELPLIGATLVSVYYFIKWCQDDQIHNLAISALAALFATGVRYEGWALLCTLLVILGYVAIRQQWSWLKLRDLTVYFGVFAGLFIIFWIFWNGIILGDPLGWIRGEYASPSNWVSETDKNVGDPVRSFRVYWEAMELINGPWLMLAGIAGLIVFAFTQKLKPQTVGFYALMFPLFFYAPLLAAGQRPLHVPQLDGSMYNIRFALQTLPFFAIMTVFAVYMGLKWIRNSAIRGFAVLWITAVLALISQPAFAITLAEPQLARESTRAQIQIQAATCLSEVYQDQETVLMETYGNERMLFESGIPLEWVIYEGSNEGGLWQSALADPSQYATWVVMRYAAQDTDKIWELMQASNLQLLDEYTLVFSNSELVVYELNSLGERGGPSCLKDQNYTALISPE